MNTTKEDQETFESKFKQLATLVLAGKAEQKHNWLVLGLGVPERRRYFIMGYPYTTPDRSVRNAIMAEALNDPRTHGARGVVAIGVNVLSDSFPYDVLARRVATDLFDTLTLPKRQAFDAASDGADELIEDLI